MSIRATTLWRHLLVVLGMGMICAPAIAQVDNSPIVFSKQDAITTSFIQTTSLGGSGNNTNTSDTGKWFKVELHYAAIPTAGNFVDEVVFKVWVEGRDLLDPTGKPDEGIAVGLIGSVTYVNVAKSKDAYAVVYLHPSTIARYNAGGGTADFDRKFNIHAEADVDGKPVDAIDKKPETDLTWYTQLKSVAGLIFMQNQSPFITTDPDRYPALKLPVAH
jgi:hypothetical protein